ncbi:rab1_7 [Blepharisma stoltei]|uniref:Uncharacterized protein n=1 Tax=Blepharisma stoltei TaxID=1481888 RepID=A0AAU9JMT1_9CILI|nr:unnamed protein product [Blepharisma stoltei]
MSLSWYFLNSDFLLNIVLLGEPATGKSFFSSSFMNENPPTEYKSTIGIDFKAKYVKYQKKCIKLYIWDPSGQAQFTNITTSYLRGRHGVFIIFSLTDRSSFEKVKFWKDLCDNSWRCNDSCILVGNWCDLEDKREITYEEAKDLADSLGILYIEVSAKNGFNIDRAFWYLIFNIMPSLRFF